VVIGAGPNGLAAAIVMAEANKSVAVFESNELPGGGVRSAELTLPGFLHDVCSAVYPLGIGSPFFRSLPLARYGLEWVESPAALAHPFDDGTAIIVDRKVETTASGLGADAAIYKSVFEPLAGGMGEFVCRCPRSAQMAAVSCEARSLRIGCCSAGAAFCRTAIFR
jgi:phytoene dehydrogenase-like protein